MSTERLTADRSSQMKNATEREDRIMDESRVQGEQRKAEHGSDGEGRKGKEQEIGSALQRIDTIPDIIVDVLYGLLCT